MAGRGPGASDKDGEQHGVEGDSGGGNPGSGKGIGEAGSVELADEEVVRLVEHYGFRIEMTRTRLRLATYKILIACCIVCIDLVSG